MNIADGKIDAAINYVCNSEKCTIKTNEIVCVKLLRSSDARFVEKK